MESRKLRSFSFMFEKSAKKKVARKSIQKMKGMTMLELTVSLGVLVLLMQLTFTLMGTSTAVCIDAVKTIEQGNTYQAVKDSLISIAKSAHEIEARPGGRWVAYYADGSTKVIEFNHGGLMINGETLVKASEFQFEPEGDRIKIVVESSRMPRLELSVAMEWKI